MIRNIAIGILFIANILLCILCMWAFRRDYSTTAKQQSDQLHRMGYLENVLQCGVENNNLMFDGETLLYGRDGETRQLKDLVSDSAQLFIRISDLHCEDCIRFILLKLVRLANEKAWPTERIVILGSYQNTRTLFFFVDQLGIRFPVFNMGKPDIPAETSNAPYCFMMDSTLRVNHLFFPDKYEGAIVNFYLDLLSNRYWLLQQSQ